MSKTPTKKVEYSICFIPKEIASPSKDCSGISKTVYTHISHVHRLLSDWVSVRDKGIKICKFLSSLKLHECEDNYYPHQTIPQINSLLEALDTLQNIVTGVNLICNQMQAIVKLHSTKEPIINTWSATEIAESISNVCDMLQKELRLKQVITENIAHCRDENLIEVYISAWEFETYFDVNSSAYLFAEVGLTGIS